MSFKNDEGEFVKVGLDTIGGGAALKLFDEELQKVLANIDDNRTPSGEKREIIVKVIVTPNGERDFGTVEIKCGSKLAPNKASATAMILRRDGKKHVAFEPVGKQGNLFDAPRVASISKE